MAALQARNRDNKRATKDRGVCRRCWTTSGRGCGVWSRAALANRRSDTATQVRFRANTTGLIRVRVASPRDVDQHVPGRVAQGASCDSPYRLVSHLSHTPLDSVMDYVGYSRVNSTSEDTYSMPPSLCIENLRRYCAYIEKKMVGMIPGRGRRIETASTFVKDASRLTRTISTCN